MDSSRVVQSKVVENKDEQNLDSQQVVTHDAEEQNSVEPEKKSVMSRVKARARKIKNSITGHSQQTPDQTSEIQHTPEDDEDDDDDGDLDEGPENVQEPVGHHAPNYGSRDVKSATPTTDSEKVENLRNLVFNLEGSKVVGEEPYHDPLTKGVSSNTETNESKNTDKAKPFDLDEKPDQFKTDFERPIVSKEDSQKQGSKTEAYDLPNYQTRDTDPNLDVYDREDVKSATPKFGSEQDETLGNSGTDFEGGRVKEEEPRRDSLFDGVSSTTSETNQNIAKPFAEEDKPDQFKANLAKLGFSKEDFEDQVNRTHEAHTPPKHQTDDTYPSEDVKNATPPPEYKNDENFGNSGTGFEGAKVKEEEPYHDSPFEGVSSTTTETNQNIAKPFAEEEKPEQFKADLERPGFSEDFEEQGSRIEANTLPKYQTSDTYPNEEGELKDTKPLEESLERLNVHDDEPKIQPHAADTEYPSSGSHDQFVPHFSDATKTKNEYPQETVSTDINKDHEFSEKDSQDQGNRTEAYTIPGYQTRDTDPSGARSDETKDFTSLEESLEKLNVHDDERKPITEQKFQPSAADTEYPASAGSHDIRQPVPHFFDASKSHNEFSQETASKNIDKHHEIPSETEGTFNTVTNTAENQPGYEESVETEPKTNKSYADENEFSSATTADKTLPHENDEALKLSYGASTDSNTNDGTETHSEDKGAAVRDYFNEKSRPGEEDKALAEVISEALHKGKDEPLKTEDGKFDSEAEKPEKVFEDSNAASPGIGYVDRVKGVVGSWFAKSEETPSPHGAGIGTEGLPKNKDSAAEVKIDGKVVGEERIQE